MSASDPISSPGLVAVGVTAVVVLIAILTAVIRMGIKGMGTDSDREAGNELLGRTALLLRGRFRDRADYPYFQRPAQYGGVEGEAGDLTYVLLLLPWNSEDHGGGALLRVRSSGRALDGRWPEARFLTDEDQWHWPDKASAEGLAAFVRQSLATLTPGSRPHA